MRETLVGPFLVPSCDSDLDPEAERVLASSRSESLTDSLEVALIESMALPDSPVCMKCPSNDSPPGVLDKVEGAEPGLKEMIIWSGVLESETP